MRLLQGIFWNNQRQNMIGWRCDENSGANLPGNCRDMQLSIYNMSEVFDEVTQTVDEGNEVVMVYMDPKNI